MSNEITALTKTIISGNDPKQVINFTMPNYKEYSNYQTQAKPLLDQATLAIEFLNKQSERLYKEQGTIAANCDSEINQLKQKLESASTKINDLEAARERNTQLNLETINDLKTNHEHQLKAIEETNRTTTIQFETTISNLEKHLTDITQKFEEKQQQYEERIRSLNVQIEAQKQQENSTNNTMKSIERINEALKKATELAYSNPPSLCPSQTLFQSPQPSAPAHPSNINQPTSHQSPRTSLANSNDEPRTAQLNIKINSTLQTFSGRANENIAEWLYGTNRLLEIGNYNDIEKVTIASSYLKDMAQQEYNLHEQTNGMPDWEGFKRFMSTRFTPSNQSDIIRNKMRQLKQINSSTKEYYIEFKKLANQLNDMSETDKVKAFIDGLRPSTAAWVRFTQKKNLEDAYEYAEHVEANGMDKVLVPASAYMSKSNQHMHTADNKKSTPPKCSHCQMIGHTANICRNRLNNENNQRSNNRKAENIVCCICQKPGHLGENCWRNRQCKLCNGIGHSEQHCRNKNQSYMTKSTREHIQETIEIISHPARIDGKKEIAVLDSASHISIMSQELAKDWEIEIDQSQRYIETSTGDKAPANGHTKELTVELEGTQAKISFVITNINAYGILLGLDWFKQTGVILDPKNQRFIIPQRIIETHNNQIESIEHDSEFEMNNMTSEINLLSLEAETEVRDDFELFDDYNCFNDNPKIVEDMKPNMIIKPETLERLEKTLVENKSSFAATADQLGCCKDFEFEIETSSDTPIHSAPYRQSPTHTQALKEEVDALLKAGIIRPGGPGTWSSPTFIISQKGKLRMVTNFKKLNKITIPYKFPQPRIDDHLESFQGTRIFSKIDLRKGFYQLAMSESTRHKTGFVTPFGIFEFNRLPFGVMNGPAIFCSVMQNIFGDLPFVKAYIDDLTIASKSEEEHVEHIRIVIERLNKFNLKMNPDKCYWFSDRLPIFGHIIDEKGLRIDSERIAPIVERKAPKNVKQVQQFLGMTNYYRRFIENYSKIAAPLHKLCGPTTIWRWTEECQQAFETLKNKLIEQPVLRSPDFHKPFILHTDASHIALGAILAQKDDQNREYVCHYASKLLKDSERVYGITELECLAVIWAMKHFQIYLQGAKFTIYTDNEALKWLKGMKSTSMRLTRWSVMLEQFDYEVKHRPGRQHQNADALSRPVLFTSEIQTNELNDQSIKNVDPYEDDALLHYLKFGKHLPGISRKQVNRIERAATLYKIKEDGIILARKNPKLEFSIIIPKPEQRQELVLKEHELGHFKAAKIHANLTAKNYFWKNMTNMIEKTIAGCEVCLKYDKTKMVNDTAIASFVDNIFDKIGIDLVTGLPTTADGYSTILVIVEYLSKFAWAYPLKTKSSEEVTNHLLTFICTYGPPKCIISDQGTEFVNATLNSLCNRMSIIRRTTSAYNSRANGQCERTNQTLIRMLIKHCDENPYSWPETLQVALLAYRTCIHSSTGKTPFEVMFGKKFSDFENWEKDEKDKETQALEYREFQIKQLFEETHQSVLDNIAQAQEKQTKTQLRSNASHDNLKIGDAVYIKNCKLIKNKFDPEYSGPYFITSRNPSSGNYTVQDQNKVQLAETFPRWKLKPIDYHIEKKTKEQPKEIDKSKYTILHVQKIGRGCRCQIQYQDGTSEWVAGQKVDPLLIARHQQKERSSRPKATNANHLSMLSIIIWILAILTTTTIAQTIKAEFDLCENSDINRIISPTLNCKTPHETITIRETAIIDLTNNLPTDIFVLSRNRYYANQIGYQCYKTRIITKSIPKYIFWHKTQTTKETIQLSRLECLTMIESKNCNNNKMSCNGEICTYTPPQIEENSALWEQQIETYECSFHKRRIISEKPESNLFATTSSACKYKDLQCTLYDSIIVWENQTNTECPLTKIHYGSNYTSAGLDNQGKWELRNFIYSNTDSLTFQLLGTTYECGVRLWKTTDDLLILLTKDQQAKNHNHIEIANEKISFNRQHDINNLILAESDAERYRQWRTAQINLDSTIYKECTTLATLLQIISKEQNTFNRIHDLNGNEIITYSANNLIHLPICQKVKEIAIRNTKDCYVDAPIFVILKNKTIEAFLTKNNFLINTSPKVNCKIINQFQILPGDKLFLIRKGPEMQIREISGVIFHDISKTQHQHPKINLQHHEQIIGNYETENHADTNEIKNDIEGKYFTLPNDKQYSEIEYRSTVMTSIDDIKDMVVDSITNNFIINSITSTIITGFIIYAIIKVAISIAQLAKVRKTKRKQTKATFSRDETCRITIIDPRLSEIISKYRGEQLARPTDEFC